MVSAQKQLQGLQFSFVTNIKEINLSCYEFKFVQPNPSGTSYESSLSTASLGLERKQHITLGLMSKKRMTGYLNKTSSKLLWKKSSALKHVGKLEVFQKYTSKRVMQLEIIVLFLGKSLNFRVMCIQETSIEPKSSN